jgi:hypothetical protein
VLEILSISQDYQKMRYGNVTRGEWMGYSKLMRKALFPARGSDESATALAESRGTLAPGRSCSAWIAEHLLSFASLMLIRLVLE